MRKKERPTWDPLRQPIYGEEDWRQLTSALGISSLPRGFAARLEDEARKFRVAASIEYELLPTRAERRAALRRVHCAAVARNREALAEAVVDLDAEAQRLLALNFDQPHADQAIAAAAVTTGIDLTDDLLSGLVGAAERAMEAVHPSGAEPKRARRDFIGTLTCLYRDAKGQPAKRRHNPKTGKDYGPFLEFVRAILTPIDPAFVKGVEDDIRWILSLREISH